MKTKPRCLARSLRSLLPLAVLVHRLRQRNSARRRERDGQRQAPLDNADADGQPADESGGAQAIEQVVA